MAELRWIKLSLELFDNRKIRQIESLPDGDGILIIWIKILCLAGQVNDGGLVYFTRDIPYTEQMLASQFNRPLALVQLALATFTQFNMIEIVDNVLCVSNWAKYQSVDRLSEIREYNRLAQQRSRAKRKELSASSDVNDESMTSQRCHETEEEKERDIEIDKKRDILSDADAPPTPKQKRFVPPSVDEVKAYCLERGNGIDPDAFIDYYRANGWHVGRGTMKDWRAAVRTWERRSKNGSATSDNRNAIGQGTARDWHLPT